MKIDFFSNDKNAAILLKDGNHIKIEVIGEFDCEDCLKKIPISQRNKIEKIIAIDKLENQKEVSAMVLDAPGDYLT